MTNVNMSAFSDCMYSERSDNILILDHLRALNMGKGVLTHPDND